MDETAKTVVLDNAQVRRLISIAARWQLLARLAGEVNAMAERRWEPLLLRTRDETQRAVDALVRLVGPAVPELRIDKLDRGNTWTVSSLEFGHTQAEFLAQMARRALLSSRLLRPLLAQFPDNSTTWWDLRKLVDRLDFDGRELAGYVRLVSPDRAAEVISDSD